MRYLKNDHEYLDGLLGQMLIDIAWNEPVTNAMHTTMINTLVDQMKGPTLYDLAVINLL